MAIWMSSERAARREKPSASRGLALRMCEPTGQAKPSRSVAAKPKSLLRYLLVPQLGIVCFRSQGQRRATRPSPDHFRCQVGSRDRDCSSRRRCALRDRENFGIPLHPAQACGTRGSCRYARSCARVGCDRSGVKNAIGIELGAKPKGPAPDLRIRRHSPAEIRRPLVPIDPAALFARRPR